MATPSRSALHRAASPGAESGEHPAGSVIDTLAGIFDAYTHGEDTPGGDRGTRSTRLHVESLVSEERRSSVRERRESKDLQVVELWKEAKAELASKNRLIAQLKARVQRDEEMASERESKLSGLSKMSRQQEELADKLKFTELQMVNMKAENARLKQAYQESLAKLAESLKILEEKARAEKKATDASAVLEAKVSELQSEKEAILSRSLLNLRTYEEETLEKEREMMGLNQRASAMHESLESVRRERVELLERVQTLEAENVRLADSANAAQSQLSSATSELRTLSAAAANDKALRAQTQHLRADNARLVRLLATTSEYASFARFAFPVDKKSGTGRSRSAYLAPTDVALREGYDEFLGGEADPDVSRGPAEADTAGWDEIEAYASHYSFPDTVPMSPTNEGDLWVPADAVRLTANFRRKHLNHVPLPLIREFMLELNAVWRRRFNKQTARIKERYTAQIKELKRMLSQRVPYREVVQKSEISRLSHDVASLRRSRSRGRSASRSRRRSDIELVDTGHEKFGWCSRMQVKTKGSGAKREAVLLEKSLATVENLSRRVAEYAEENEELHKSIASLHETTVTKTAATTTSMQAFNRGVNWFGRQVVRMADKLGANVADLTEELQQCCTLATASDSNLSQIRQQTTAVSGIQRHTTEFRTAVRQLFERALATGKSAKRFEALFSAGDASRLLDESVAVSPPRGSLAETEAWT